MVCSIRQASRSAAGVDPQTAEREACRMEHTISQRSFELLKGAVEPE